jgi:hypothetical protein
VPLFLRKIFPGSCSKNQQKLRGNQCLRRPRFVLLPLFRPNKGIETSLRNDFTPYRDALQFFSASYKKPPGAAAIGD